MSNIKRHACKDCRYYYREFYSYGGAGPAKCLHPSFFSPIEDDGVPVEYARLESKKCGPSGKLWQPIERQRHKPGWFARTFFGEK